MTLGAKVGGQAGIPEVAAIALEAAVEQYFQKTVESIKVHQEAVGIEVPAKTRQEYTIVWRETRHEGSIGYTEDGKPTTAHYNYRVGIEMVSAIGKDILCPTTTPSARADEQTLRTPILPNSTPQPTSLPSNTLTPQPTRIPVPTPTPTQNPILFADDFKNGIKPAWKQTQGEWIAVNGALKVLNSDSDFGQIEVVDPSWNDYSIDFDTEAYGHNYINGYDSYLILYVGADKDNAVFFRLQWNGVGCGVRKQGKDTDVSNNGGVTSGYHVHLVVSGQSYELSTANNASCTLSYPGLNQGGIRIRVKNGSTGWPLIKNFTVRRIQ